MHLSDITPSLFSSLGLSTADDSLGVGQSPHGREVLLLIDGLGEDSVEKYSELIPHISSLKKFGIVKTAFPSTTSTSLATLTTGTLPGTHGMLGYMVQVPRSGGRILNALKWDERVDPVIWQPVPTLFERARDVGIKVSHVAAKRYEGTGFTRAVFRGADYVGANVVDDLATSTAESLRKTPSFVYLYMNDVDMAGHSDGVGSEKWRAALALVDSLVGKLAEKVPSGTRLWLTADHGMINASHTVILGEGNNLLDEVSTLAGEPRARHIYLKEEYATGNGLIDTRNKWANFLGDEGVVLTREESISQKLFGEKVTTDARDRIGELVVIARGGLILVDPTRTHLEAAMIGHHGSDSEIETSVPFLTTTF